MRCKRCDAYEDYPYLVYRLKRGVGETECAMLLTILVTLFFIGFSVLVTFLVDIGMGK